MADVGVWRGAPVSRLYSALVILAAVGAIVFWLGAVVPYLSLEKEKFGRFPELFWDRRQVLWLHIFGGTLALFTGPVQLWLGEKRQRLPLHRTLGMVYLAGVAIGNAGAYYMAFTTPVGLPYAAGLFGMALASTLTTLMAYAAIRRRNFLQHREWMIRSYITIAAFVTFRALVVVMEINGIGGTGREGDLVRATLAAWSSWALPLLIAEVVMQWPKFRRAA